MKFAWTVVATEEQGGEQWLGQGETPRLALARLHEVLQAQSDSAMRRASESMEAIARVRGQLAALDAE